MVRIDTLRSALLALLPIAALLPACAGTVEGTEGAADQNPTTEMVAQDDPTNMAKVEGTEAEDEGYAAAIGESDAEAAAAAAAPDEPNEEGTASKSDALLSTRGTTFVNEARRNANELNRGTSYYSHTTYMNESTDTRRTDCSGFVGYAMNRVAKDAYAKVPHPNTYKPLADDWYNYLSTRYTTPSSQSTPRFRKIVKAMDLKPGDLVVWLKPVGQVSENTGHIMVVTGYPKAGRAGEVIVPIIDSTTAPHANDSRGTSHTGIGTGSIGLKVNSTGAPTHYYWRGGLSYNAISTKIAMGRLE